MTPRYLRMDFSTFYLVLFSGPRHEVRAADCHRNTRHSSRLVHQVQEYWPQKHHSVCPGWGWCDDRHAGSSWPEHSNPAVGCFRIPVISDIILNICCHTFPTLFLCHLQTAVQGLPDAAFLCDLWGFCVEVCRASGSWPQYHQAEARRGDTGHNQAVLRGLPAGGRQV